VLPSSITLLENELLFSGLTRLARVNGLMDTRDALLRLTGGRNYAVSADLPSHLRAIVERVGRSISVEDVDVLIEGHTLYPYYRLFMPAERWLRVRDIALSHEGGRLKAAMGVLAHGIGASPVLRYCPVCLRAMRANAGTSFWHRFHHLPGVVACPLHGCRLVPLLSQAQLGHRARLWPPPQQGSARAASAHEAQLRFALISRDALCYRGDPLGAVPIRDAYAAAIASRGWTYRNGRVHIGALISALRCVWANAAHGQAADRFRLEGDGPMPWILDVLSPRPRSHSPLSHLLLVHLLFDDFDHFVKACHVQRHHPPDRALRTANLATAFSARDFKGEPPDRFARARSMITQTSRSCREIAACCGVSVGWVVTQRRIEGIPIRERRKILDNRRLETIKALLGQGLPVAVIARRCRLSASSIYRALSADPALVANRQDQRLEQVRERCRAQWANAASVATTEGINALRRAAPACYAWLYRNDRAWLLAHQPARPLRQSSPQRVDWERRDAELAQQVTDLEPGSVEAMQRLLTPAGTASLVYPSSSLRRHADKLPQFAAAVRRRAACSSCPSAAPSLPVVDAHGMPVGL